RIEAKLLVGQPNHVAPGEDPLTLHALLVHERPVGTRVDQQIALWRLDDLGVPARNVLPRYHHVAPRLAAEHQRRRGDHVLTAVRETYNPTARHADGRRFDAGLGRSGGRLRCERLHELRAPRPPLIHEGELVTADLDLVAVQEGCRLGAEAD